MKLTFKLTGIYFKEMLMNLVGGNKKKTNKSTPILILGLFAFIGVAIGYSLYNMASTLSLVGLAKNVIIIGLLMAVFTSLMITLNDTQGTMYKSKDYNMLMSLPLKDVSIITAKYLGTYLISILYFTIIAVPTFVVYFIFEGVTASGIIFGLLSLLYMPAFSQLISCCLGWVVNAITSRMSNKNIMRTIFSLVLALGLALFISLANNDMMGNLFTFGIPLWFKIVFAHIYLLFMAITNASVWYFLASVGVCLLFMMLGVLIISIGFKKINSNLLTTRTSKKTKPITYKKQSVIKNLYKKEFATFFNSPVYCTNGLIGNIMVIVVAIISIATYNTLKEISMAGDIMIAVAVFSICMCTGIAPTTSVTISMEGSKLQNLKCLPIKFIDIALSKILLNLTFSLPTCVIAIVVLSIFIPMGWMLLLVSILYAVVTVIAQTILGLLLNLRFPRLNWTSETQAAKGGLSMFLTMILDLILAMAPMIIFMLLLQYVAGLSLAIFLVITLAIALVVMLVLGTILFICGEKIFKHISV